MNSYELVKTLRLNSAVKLAFNNQERVEDLAGRVGSQIEADSLSLLTAFKDSIFLKENGFNEENVLAMFIPNTYEVYWNTTAVKFRDKMIKEYRNFWTTERVAKAKKQGLTPIEATILASIVHKESVKKDEKEAKEVDTPVAKPKKVKEEDTSVAKPKKVKEEKVP